MNILVTGGTGFLGRHLAAALLERSAKVFLLGRNFAPVEDLLAKGAVPVEADLRDGAAVREACKGMEVVYHAGALSAPWGKRADFFATNVGGTEALLAGCQKYAVRRLVSVSSPSVVFDGGDQFQASEQVAYPRRFTSVYALTKKLGEDRVRAASATGLETVILRPKAIFGPGDQTLLPRLISAARQQRLPQIGDGRNLVDLTYVGNVVHALFLAAESSNAVGKTYTITNGEHAPLWEVIRDVLQRLGLRNQLRAIPLALALSAASLMEARSALTGIEPLLTRYSVLILARTQTYDISAAQRELGYTPQISLADGIARTLESLKGEA
ncbi:MAG TPA: NAD-dependent epimerase/dehydratase family protein [Ktedonobacteraceae bacterium]|nr:NAD-dependent epimerase/dehydratase family protein [Ktedonobacteraceae bacterium]